MLERFVIATIAALHMHAVRWWREYAFFLVATVGITFLAHSLFISTPANFPLDVTLTISPGTSLTDVAAELRWSEIIRSETAFKLFVYVRGASDRIHAGRYRFYERQNTFIVAERLIDGVSGIPPIRITFPEGTTNARIAELVHEKFSDISIVDFIAESTSDEGYLFPDTYIFDAGDTIESIIKRLRDNFDERTARINVDIGISGHSLEDIVIMASILEAETNNPDDRGIVAGVLWRRLAIGMPLQVDPSPETYKKKGLPARPLNNPGFEALVAALRPTKSAFLYYLTGKDGKMRYAKTFAEHQTNIITYLK